jgi:hypothetical protein
MKTSPRHSAGTRPNGCGDAAAAAALAALLLPFAAGAELLALLLTLVLLLLLLWVLLALLKQLALLPCWLLLLLQLLMRPHALPLISQQAPSMVLRCMNACGTQQHKGEQLPRTRQQGMAPTQAAAGGEGHLQQLH